MLCEHGSPIDGDTFTENHCRVCWLAKNKIQKTRVLSAGKAISAKPKMTFDQIARMKET